MARKLQSDKWLFLATLALVCVSVVMVYSASAVVALDKYQQPYYFVTRQVMWALLGLSVLSIVMRIDYRTYQSEQLVWTALGVVAVLLVAVLFMRPINGSHRWFGFGGLGIQPSELAKVVAILFTAVTLDRRMHRIAEPKYALLPVAVISAGLAALILVEPDFGTAAALLAVVAAMVLAAGLPWRYLVGLGLAAVPTAYILIVSAPYRLRRFMAFLNPDADPLGDGFHIIQSTIAVGSGGMLGRGLMGGMQKLFFLPEPHTDFIFAVIAEELGFVGATLVVACFTIIAWRGLRAATAAPDRFGAFLALGITTMVVAQAFVNLSVVLGLMPTKGIPLPLVSSGGSSLLVNLASIGVLLNISQHGVEERAAVEPGVA
ncbi:MAG: putative lipid II flippase FtsW [Vicinamibacterales bacterium]